MRLPLRHRADIHAVLRLPRPAMQLDFVRYAPDFAPQSFAELLKILPVCRLTQLLMHAIRAINKMCLSAARFCHQVIFLPGTK